MKESASTKIVSLKGSLTIDKAAGLKEELRRTLGTASSVLVDFSSVEDLDLACLQTLYSAAIQAKSLGARLGFRGKLSARIAKRLHACGFVRGMPEQAEGLENSLLGFQGSGA